MLSMRNYRIFKCKYLGSMNLVEERELSWRYKIDVIVEVRVAIILGSYLVKKKDI